MRVVVMAIMTFAVLATCLYGMIAIGVARLRKLEALESADWQARSAAAKVNAENSAANSASATEPAASDSDALPEPPPSNSMIFLMAPDARLSGANMVLVDEHGVATRMGKPVTLDTHASHLLPKAPSSGRAIQPYVARFYDKEDMAEWTFAVLEPAKYSVNIVYSCKSWTSSERGTLHVTVGGQEFLSEVVGGKKNSRSLHMQEVGTVELPAGQSLLRVSMESHSLKPPAVALRSIRLYKAE